MGIFVKRKAFKSSSCFFVIFLSDCELVVMFKLVTKCFEFYETVDIQCTIVSNLTALHYAT